jgi:hypothetical protein
VRGSIRTKVPGRVYELRVALGKDPATGRYRQQSVIVRGSRSDAQRALRRLLDEVESGQRQRPDRALAHHLPIKPGDTQPHGI